MTSPIVLAGSDSQNISAVDWRIAELKRVHDGRVDEILLELGKPNPRDCEQREVWAYFSMLALAQGESGAMPEATRLEKDLLELCQPVGYMSRYLLASLDFLNKQYTGTIERADDLLADDLPLQVRAEVLNLKGVAQIFSNLPSEARLTFDDLAKYGDVLSAQNWNNIAVLFLDLGDWSRARQYLHRGLAHPDLKSEEWTLLQLNLLLSYTLAEDLDGGMELANQLPIDSLFQDESSLLVGDENRRRCAEILLDWYLFSDDLTSYERHEDVLKAWWLPSGFDRMNGHFAYHLMLAADSIGPRDWDLSLGDRWQLANSFSNYGVSSEVPMLPSYLAEIVFPKALPADSVPDWWIAIGLFAGALTLLLLRHQITQYRQNRHIRTGEDEVQLAPNASSELPAIPSFQSLQSQLFEQIRDLPDDRQALIVDTFRRMRAVLWKNKLQSLDMLVENFELTGTERRVLELIVAGNVPKEIARTLSMSDSYIYNVRARLRERFEIERGVSLEQWIERQIRS